MIVHVVALKQLKLSLKNISQKWIMAELIGIQTHNHTAV